MKAEASIRKNRFLNLILVGLPGAGKTKFILDFPNPVIIDFDYGDLTAQDLGINIPILHPTSEDEIRAIIEAPEMITEKVIQQIPGFEEYQPKTFAFDTITTMQDVIMGEGARASVEISGVTLPARKATGILSLPSTNRDSGDMPAWGDSHVFGVRMRKLMLAIKQMPYHTICSAHLGPSDQLQVSAKPDKKTGIRPKPKAGYPLLHGQLKWQLGGLTDFYLELEKKGGGFTEYKYIIHTQQKEAMNTKNRLTNHLEKNYEWTNKNAFELLNKPLQKAMEESLKK